MLKPDPTTTNYILYLLVPGFASLRGCRGRELGGMVNIYNLLLYNAAATTAALLPLLLYLNCWLFLPSCCKNRRKMLVFDRLSYSLLPWYFYLAVHYTASPSILIQVHKCLEFPGLSLAEYARYSPLLYFPPFSVYPTGCCNQTLEPWSLGAGDSRCRPPQCE